MAASEILRRNPAARIVFATVHDEAEMVKKSWAMGVLGYVLKLRAGKIWSRRFTLRCGGSVIFRRAQQTLNEDRCDPNLLPRN